MQASASRDERSASPPLWKRKPDRRAVVIGHTHDRHVGGNRRGRGRWKAFLPSCFADITPSYHQTTLPRRVRASENMAWPACFLWAVTGSNRRPLRCKGGSREFVYQRKRLFPQFGGCRENP